MDSYILPLLVFFIALIIHGVLLIKWGKRVSDKEWLEAAETRKFVIRNNLFYYVKVVEGYEE